MELIEKHASFGGWQNVYRHYSQSLKCEMNVGVYLPPKAANEKLSVLYWLSGLTCNEQNFITKSGMQRYAAEHNIIVVAPDTSPRGSHVADADRYDLGQGAGFYLNATQAPWNEHYKMYDYIRNELPDLVMHHFPATAKKSISGHSMGGLGALVLALPALRWAIKAVGIGYLLWLALRLARSGQLSEADAARLSVGFWQGTLLQFVNIKAWLLALTIVAGWVVGQPDHLQRLALVLPVMMAFAFASNLTYAAAGALLRHWLAHGRRLLWFNRVMAAVLVATALWMVAA